MSEAPRSTLRAAGVALAGVALTLVALTFEVAPLFVPGIAFALLGAVAPAWVWLAARGVSIERRLDTKRVVEGEPLEATIKVSGGRLSLPCAEIVDPLAGAPVRLGGGMRVATLRVVARFERRGLKHLAPPSVAVGDALGLARIVRVGAEPDQELLVLPRVEPVRWAQDGRDDRSDRVAASLHANALAAVDIDGLRPYRVGTPASRIHWPALARGAGLLERRLRADGDTRPLVVLDARTSGSTDDVDAAVRAAASLAFELARSGGCGLLLPGERRPATIDADLIAWPSAHVRLALVEGGAGARPPSLAGASARLGPVFYVAARSLDRLPAAIHGIARSASVLVLPTTCSEGGAPLVGRAPVRPSFAVGGCHGFVLKAGRRARGASSGRRAA